MPHTTMYFEDAPDGLIDFRIDWHQPNVDPQSPAHKAAIMVFNFLEKEAAKKLVKPPVDTTPTDVIQNGNSAGSAENIEEIQRMPISPLIQTPRPKELVRPVAANGTIEDFQRRLDEGKPSQVRA